MGKVRRSIRRFSNLFPLFPFGSCALQYLTNFVPVTLDCYIRVCSDAALFSLILPLSYNSVRNHTELINLGNCEYTLRVLMD